MLLDAAYKLARKSLSQGLYNWVSYDFLKRRETYERLETYRAISRHYRSQGVDARDKRVLEVGCGLQYFTGFGFLEDGAREVLLVEPKLKRDDETIRRQLEAFNAGAGAKLPREKAASLRVFGGLDQVPDDLLGTVDLVCSYTVLEHVGDLDGFFRRMAGLLAPGGRAYHLVDLSDHTYQVFARIPGAAWLNEGRGLYHLRYSRRVFGLLNDGKCWMNRVLLPAYLELCARNGLEVEGLETTPYKRVPIHRDVLAGLDDRDPGKLFITTFSLKLRKAAAPAGPGQSPV